MSTAPPTLRFTNADGRHALTLDGPSTSIGRSEGQDVVLSDQCVSRQHALIVREGDCYFIVDRNSSRGTFLNGVRVQRAQLNLGDLLQLGSLDGPQLYFEPTPDGADSNRSGPVRALLSSLQPLAQSAAGVLPAAREMEQLNWLLSAARQLNAGGAIEDILTTLLQLTLQLTGAERGYVFLREGSAMKLASGLNANGQVIQEDSTISRRAMRKAIESDAKFSISDTLSDNSASAWASVMANRIRSVYCIPLRKRDAKNPNADLLGLLYLDSQVGSGNLSEVDHQLLDTIATEAAALLQNALLAEAEAMARRAREELAVAAQIHNSLMTITMPVIPFAGVQARSIPCYEIGGDFFDALALDDCVCVTIADVSGKGIPAAIVAATMQGIIHAQLLSGHSLPEIAAQVNQFLCTRNVGKYATMVLLKLFQDGRLEYMNCGHIPPLLVHDSGLNWLDGSNTIVGLIADATYSSMQTTLQPGDRILLATDGLLEAENTRGDAIGESGFAEVARTLDLNGILDHVVKFSAPNEAQDDCTLVQVNYIGGAASAPGSDH
ncbi:MAG: SpoIIE family protein phosphatase [Terracidiphilus sp.]|jgi:sigma-B regulation protein RsbU (phosphoserine phosphatase)